MPKWLIATCRECGDEVPYLPEWDEPQYCKECRFYKEDCAICGRVMQIGRGWEHPPRVHKECREQAQAEREERNAKWYDTHCKECGTVMRVCREWDKQPEYCKACAFYEIDCGICDRPLRVHRSWSNVPWAHKECREKYAPREVDCETCGATIPLSTKFQVKCRKMGWDFPKRCRPCKHDSLLIQGAIGALRDELGVPLTATIERRGVLFTHAVAIVRHKFTGETLAEVTMDDQGIIFTERVAVAKSVRNGHQITTTREGTPKLFSGQRTADTRSTTTGKRTHQTTLERQGIIVQETIAKTRRADGHAKPIVTRSNRSWLDRLLGRGQHESD